MAATITYEHALATLEAMFPACDKTIISVVLQQNRGHMERTVEHLMALSAGNNATPPTKPKPTPKPPAASSAPASNKPKPQSSAANANRDGQKEPTPSPAPAAPAGSGIQIAPAGQLSRQNSAAEVKHPHPAASGAPKATAGAYAPQIGLTDDRLPDDFLRPPSFFRHTVNSQVSQDEQIALQLAAGVRDHSSSAGLPMALPVPGAGAGAGAGGRPFRPNPSQQSSNRVASDAEIAAAAGGNDVLAQYQRAQQTAQVRAAAAAADREPEPKARNGDYEAIS